MKATSKRRGHRKVLHVNEHVSLEEQIAKRAYDLWHRRGRVHGGDLNDWLQAEREINEWHQKQLSGKNPSRPDTNSV